MYNNNLPGDNMNLVYTYDGCEKNLTEVKLLDFNTDILFDTFKNTFIMVRYLLKRVFNINKCKVKILESDILNETNIVAKIAIKTDNLEMIGILYDDKISFISEDFTIDFEVNITDAKLVLYTFYDGEARITEKFSTHVLELEIIYEDNIKYFLKLPFDIKTLFPLNLVKNIKKDCSVNDLIKFYRRFIYPLQIPYEQKNCEVILRKTLIIDDNNGVLDEVILKNNMINSYILSSYSNDIIITLQNGIYTINGVNLDKGIDENVNIVSLCNQLNTRRKELK